MNSKEIKLGILYTFSAYVIWGTLTLYWGLLENVSAMEVLAHRIIWAAVFMIILLFATNKFQYFLEECKYLFHHWKSFVGIILASIFISINWFIFIWAVQNNHVLQASLGYYINPLVSILLGIIVLREAVSKQQAFAFILAAVGVLYLTIMSGVFPWISLIMAFSFATYGLLKKKIQISAINGLTIETFIISPVAIIYLLSLPEQGFDTTSLLSVNNLLLLGGGIATAIPLLLFSSGAKTIPLSMVGILQFITPTMMLFIGIFLFNEPFSQNNFIAFLFIWTALALYLISVYRSPRAS